MLIEECYVYIVIDLCTFVSIESRMGTPAFIPLARARQLLDTEVGAEILRAATARIGQVLCVNTKPMLRIANPISL